MSLAVGAAGRHTFRQCLLAPDKDALYDTKTVQY